MRCIKTLSGFFIIAILVLLAVSANHARAQAPGCGVIIEKVAIPADDTPFDFTTVGSGPAAFTLMDPSDATRMFTMGGGTEVTVTEDVPEGWRLAGIECSETDDQITVTEVEAGVTITCAIGPSDVACTFINAQIADVPALTVWGLVALVAVLAVAGFMMMRRRKVAA